MMLKILMSLFFISQMSFAKSPLDQDNICRKPAQYCSLAFEACYHSYECCSNLCQGGLCANEPQRACSVPGEFCRYGSDCCTNTCVRGQCTGNVNEKAPVGVNCDYHYQCQSGYCNAQQGVCGGGTNSCASVGQYCERSGECCTNSCDAQLKTCMATTQTPRHEKRSGVPCRYNYQCPQYCESGRCI